METRGISVLFIGNSYTSRNNLPGATCELLRSLLHGEFAQYSMRICATDAEAGDTCAEGLSNGVSICHPVRQTLVDIKR